VQGGRRAFTDRARQVRHLHIQEPLVVELGLVVAERRHRQAS
jgi:hypothetical protein